MFALVSKSVTLCLRNTCVKKVPLDMYKSVDEFSFSPCFFFQLEPYSLLSKCKRVETSGKDNPFSVFSLRKERSVSIESKMS